MRMRAVLLAVFSLLAGCGAAPDERSATRREATAAPLSSAALDAEARLLSQLAPRLDQSAASLTPVTRQDGGRSLRMNGRFSQAQIARRKSDGSVATTCVDNLEAAKAALRGAVQ